MPSLITKKEDKINAVFHEIGSDASEELFIAKFKELYPNDWHRIQSKYYEEKQKTKPGKKHPMPHPDTYLRNMYKVAMKKRDKE